MLKDILSISGHSGLFKLVAQSTKSIIVESLETHQKMPVYYTNKVSALEDIAIFTEEDEVTLQSVFQSIFKKENGAALSIPKDNNALKAYFADVLPNYDRERVYVSNIKKVLAWYNLLVEHKLVDLEEEKAEEEKGE